MQFQFINDFIATICCGSAASWIVRNLLRNKGGLHNRVTCRIHLKPFTLAECAALAHLPQIRAALGISGIHIKAYTWYHKPDDICSDGAQVDLVIERADNVINLCEMKYSRGAFRIDKSYAAELRNKISVYEATEHTRKALHLTMIASNGLAPNEYSGLIQSTLTLDALFGQ